MDGDLLLPSVDEFGGYSSRLRLHEAQPELTENDQNNFEQNLCALLGIDIEAMAFAIVMEDKRLS